MREHNRGFTLIELLITILIATILLTAAIPSFLSSVHSQQTANVAQTFVQDVAWARGQAISGAAAASLTLSDNCTWDASTGSAADVAHSMSSAQLQSDAPTLSCTGIPAGGLAFSFDSMGLVDPPPASSSVITFTPGVGLPVSIEVFGSGVVVENPTHAS